LSSVLQRGRLSSQDKDAARFASSLEQDKRIGRATVLTNEAHVAALVKAGIIGRTEGRKLARVLKRLEDHLPYEREVEDVHVLIEEEVSRILGARIGGVLHTAKSRNDQVSTAIRMVLRMELLQLSNQILHFVAELVRESRKYRKSFFVGYTHLQPAQPLTFSHYLLAIGDSLLRDSKRTIEVIARVNLSPMGAGALAGSSFKLDRNYVARLLGFKGLVENSLDAVASRDFVLESLAACTILALDLSRISQDLIFYSSADVALVTLPDEFASTSTIMPQKKNPDVLEVIRARCARVTTNFSTAVTTVHALPTGYNLDFQELTPLLWDSMDTLQSSLRVLIRLISRLSLNGGRMKVGVELIAATEVANTLVRAGGFPFRQAHRAVGRAVRVALESGVSLGDLRKEQWESFLEAELNPRVLEQVAKASDLKSSFHGYKTRGSPNPEEVDRMRRARVREIALALRSNKHAETKITHSIRELNRITASF
jgi:argininosuccinate lyase